MVQWRVVVNTVKYSLVVDSASKRNEYQEYSWGYRAAGA
jgi:hypothetical protein